MHAERLGHLLEIELILVAAPQQRLLHDLDAPLDVAQLIRVPEAVDPHGQTVQVDEQHDGVPEPDEREYLLVEQVDGQHALHRVPVAHLRVAHLADPKVAHAYFGKDARARVPALAVEDLVEQLEAKLVKLVAEQQIQQEHLTNAVGYEGQLDEQIQHHQVVAEELAAYAADGGEEAFDDEAAARLSASTRVVTVLVHRRQHVAHVLFSYLVLVHRLVVARRLHNVAHVNARATRQRPPCYVRNVEEERL